MPPPRVHRTPDAIADLDGIWDYIARDSPRAADLVLDELNDRFALLAGNPEIGELQPTLADGNYRRFTHRSYVVYYRPQENGIVIVRVLHGARVYENLM